MGWLDSRGFLGPHPIQASAGEVLLDAADVGSSAALPSTDDATGVGHYRIRRLIYAGKPDWTLLNGPFRVRL